MAVRGITRLLRNRTFILASALVGGLTLSGLASGLSGLTLPALAVVLTVSITQVGVRDFVPLSRFARSVSTALALNYLLLGSLILILARWLMPSEELWVGYVLVAAAPPGIAIVPFTHILRGDLRLSVQGTFGAYLASLLLAPAMVYLLAGAAAASPARLFRTILMLILIPFAVAQAIRVSPAARSAIDRLRGTIINWGFFVVVFTAVGVNRDVFLRQPAVLLAVTVPAIASSFGLSRIVEIAGARLGLPTAITSTAMLLSTMKNAAFAAAVGLALYGEATSVPGAVLSAWYALYFIYLGIKGERGDPLRNPQA